MEQRQEENKALFKHSDPISKSQVRGGVIFWKVSPSVNPSVRLVRVGTACCPLPIRNSGGNRKGRLHGCLGRKETNFCTKESGSPHWLRTHLQTRLLQDILVQTLLH